MAVLWILRTDIRAVILVVLMFKFVIFLIMSGDRNSNDSFHISFDGMAHFLFPIQSKISVKLWPLVLRKEMESLICLQVACRKPKYVLSPGTFKHRHHVHNKLLITFVWSPIKNTVYRGSLLFKFKADYYNFKYSDLYIS